MKKVLVGMSGGVDSSVSALVLMEKGYEVCGCTMKMFDRGLIAPESENNDIEDAARVCQRLGIEHIVLDVSDSFADNVMKPFVDSYINGQTPNPCIFCNKHIKFGYMLHKAEELGFDYISTGHYADIAYNDEKGRWLLKRPFDRRKDQTYVLYNMTQHQLEHTIFPLYGMEKAEIRKIAEDNDLITSHKRDSQDICFIPDKDYVSFIGRFSGYVPQRGAYISAEGKKIGEHNGYICYTIGQRKGLGVAMGKPVFVTEKNSENNTVTLSDTPRCEKKLYLSQVNLISVAELSDPMRVTAKIRYSGREQAAVIYPIDEKGIMCIEFDEPARDPAAGQSCVFYDGDIAVGGGIIL